MNMIYKIFLTILIIYALIITWFVYPIFFEDVYEPSIVDSSLSDEQWEFLQDVSELILYAKMKGYKLTSGELKRTMYQQRRYIAKGLSWTLNSRHLKSLAIDLNLFINNHYQRKCKAYEDIGKYWESLNTNNVWGGSWKSVKDCVHFERRY